MSYVIVLERALHPVKVIGPFPHLEDAEDYAEDKLGGDITIWRVTELTAP